MSAWFLVDNCGCWKRSKYLCELQRKYGVFTFKECSSMSFYIIWKPSGAGTFSASASLNYRWMKGECFPLFLNSFSFLQLMKMSV